MRIRLSAKNFIMYRPDPPQSTTTREIWNPAGPKPSRALIDGALNRRLIICLRFKASGHIKVEVPLPYDMLRGFDHEDTRKVTPPPPTVR